MMVLFPTRGQNTLDLLFTSHPTIIDKCKALPALGRSDHDTVLIDLALTAHQHWYCDLTVVMSFTSCSMYSPSVLLGGL
jgi:hypothetical protein